MTAGGIDFSTSHYYSSSKRFAISGRDFCRPGGDSDPKSPYVYFHSIIVAEKGDDAKWPKDWRADGQMVVFVFAKG